MRLRAAGAAANVEGRPVCPKSVQVGERKRMTFRRWWTRDSKSKGPKSKGPVPRNWPKCLILLARLAGFEPTTPWFVAF
jgi:hypothetical protein